jgi:hypothetical protein
MVGHLNELMPVSAEDRGDVDMEEEGQKNIFEKFMDKMDMEDHDVQIGHM